jgi:hypothetical protein
MRQPSPKFYIALGTFLVMIASFALVFSGVIFAHIVESVNIFIGLIIGFITAILIITMRKYGSYIAVSGYRKLCNLIKTGINIDNREVEKHESPKGEIRVERFLEEYEKSNIPKSRNEMGAYPILYHRLFLLDQDKSSRNSKNIYISRQYSYELAFNYLRFEGQISETLHYLKNHTGPIIALRNPGEALPPADMQIVGIEEIFWKKNVARLMRVSRLVILAVECDENVPWEVKAMYKILPPERVMLYFPPADEERQHAWHVFINATQDYFPNALPERIGNGIFMWFDHQCELHIAEGRGWWCVVTALQQALGEMGMWEKPPPINLPTPPPAPTSHRRHQKR